jgi:hypothetical protein
MIYLLDVTHNDFTFHLKFSLTFMTLKVYYSVELFHLITNKKIVGPLSPNPFAALQTVHKQSLATVCRPLQNFMG